MTSQIDRFYRFLLKVLRFVLYGIPALLIAFPLNWLLTEKAGWHHSAAYALVMLVQVTINFFVCIWFVFKRDKNSSLWSQFLGFMAGISAARFLDWALYTVLVNALHSTLVGISEYYYLLIQAGNVIIFSFVKFLLARRALEGQAAKAEI